MRGHPPKERSKRALKGLIPSYVPFKLESSSLKLIYKELRNIPVKDYPNAAHDLLRSFLECTLVFYLKKTGEYDSIVKHEKHNPPLAELLNFIMSDKCTSITDEHIKGIAGQIKSDYAQNYSLVRMNLINHNENWVSSENEVRSAWSKLEALMKTLLNPGTKDDQ